MIQTHNARKHERGEKGTDANNHFCPPHLVRYGWGHYDSSAQHVAKPDSQESVKKIVLGSNQVHPLNISDTDLEQDKEHGHDDYESSGQDSDSDDVRIEIVAPQLEPPPDPDTASMINTLCESPHRFSEMIHGSDLYHFYIVGCWQLWMTIFHLIFHQILNCKLE